jgi:tetratricopeptide (TPR) repeat protein
MRAAIDRAFAVDSQIGEAYVARGIVQLFWDRDWTGAERSLRRAIALNPSDPHAWHQMGNYWRAMARPDAAAEARLRGLALDPLDPRLRYTLGEDYIAGGRLQEARAAFEQGARLDPLNTVTLGLGPTPPRGTWTVDLAQGREAAGVQALLIVATVRGTSADDVESLRRAYASGGIRAFWRRWLAIDRRERGPSMDPLRFAGLAALAGDTAQALDALERAWGEQHPGLIFMRTEPAFAVLRASARYRRIEAAMRFPTR